LRTGLPKAPLQGAILAELLKGESCPSCGQPHDFCFAGAGPLCMDAWYAFTCPETGEVAFLQPLTGAATVPQPPPGTVTLTAADAP